MTLPAPSLTGLQPLAYELKPWDILFSFLVDARKKKKNLLTPLSRGKHGWGGRPCYLSSKSACFNFGVQAS